VTVVLAAVVALLGVALLGRASWCVPPMMVAGFICAGSGGWGAFPAHEGEVVPQNSVVACSFALQHMATLGAIIRVTTRNYYTAAAPANDNTPGGCGPVRHRLFCGCRGAPPHRAGAMSVAAVAPVVASGVGTCSSGCACLEPPFLRRLVG